LVALGSDLVFEVDVEELECLRISHCSLSFLAKDFEVIITTAKPAIAEAMVEPRSTWESIA